jgi:hypothetical protein
MGHSYYIEDKHRNLEIGLQETKKSKAQFALL